MQEILELGKSIGRLQLELNNVVERFAAVVEKVRIQYESGSQGGLGFDEVGTDEDQRTHN